MGNNMKGSNSQQLDNISLGNWSAKLRSFSQTTQLKKIRAQHQFMKFSINLKFTCS